MLNGVHKQRKFCQAYTNALYITKTISKALAQYRRQECWCCPVISLLFKTNQTIKSIYNKGGSRLEQNLLKPSLQETQDARNPALCLTIFEFDTEEYSSFWRTILFTLVLREQLRTDPCWTSLLTRTVALNEHSYPCQARYLRAWQIALLYLCVPDGKEVIIPCTLTLSGNSPARRDCSPLYLLPCFVFLLYRFPTSPRRWIGWVLLSQDK